MPTGDSASGSAEPASSEPTPPSGPGAGFGPEPGPDPGPAAPLLRLREDLPPVTDSPQSLHEVVERVAAASGPIALDAERASGYRYSARAYLIQLRRDGAGTALIDPTVFPDLTELEDVIGQTEWILHAANQDLPCLREVGLIPHRLFDTELAARLLGYPRVGLATLVEVLLDRSMRKEHSAVDWSKRPLPPSWLEYAALDVEVLVELRDRLGAELVEAGKDQWAAQEFQHLIDHVPAPRADRWRRTSGIHKARGRRALAAVRELWLERDLIARERDTTPGRLIPDSAIVAAANAMPRTRGALLETRGFHGRGARRHLDRWLAAVDRARKLPDSELPPPAARSEGPPQPRMWAERDPIAAARLVRARSALATFAEERAVPVENLLTPDYLRRVLWKPPAAEAGLEDAVGAELRALGARPWQIEITAPILAEAILRPAG